MRYPLHRPSQPLLGQPALQRRLDDLLEHLPAGVVVHGTDGCILSVNQRACTLLGREERHLIGSEASATVWDFMHGDGSPMLPADYPVSRVLGSGQTVADVVVGVRGTDAVPTRWLICNAYPEFEDERLQRVVVCFTDCSALKHAEHALLKSEERLRLALKGSTDAVWDWDLRSGELFYGDRWWDMLGYVPGELQADAGLWVRLTHPDDQARLEAFVDALLAGPRDAYSIEFRLLHKDGHEVPVLSRGIVLRDGSGKALRLSGTNTDLTERKLAERHIHRLAYFDHVTGLPNRRLLIDRLADLMARAAPGQAGALLLIDLDNFKRLNDTMGHKAGDMLLNQVAQRLHAILPVNQLLARMGGDEFAIVIEHAAPGAQAEASCHAVATAVMDALTRPFALLGHTCSITSSIGMALFRKGEGDLESLLGQAELALYRAKAEGRNTIRCFDPSMQAAADRQAELERALRDGLARRQFVLYCQPQFASDGRLSGGEVLVRWQHAERGLVGPAEFIDLAETLGLIGQLGQLVLEESCRVLAQWTNDPALRELELAVNVSVHQMRDPGFPRAVEAVLAATGAPPGRLWLELTESVFAEDMQTLIGCMQALRALGIRFALDDFGTGYSSLAYLKRLPLAALKIDRTFVHDVLADPNGDSFVEAIVALARKLKLKVIAEGVENDAQRSYLLACGCDGLQGFLLGRPMPIDAFTRLHGAPRQD